MILIKKPGENIKEGHIAVTGGKIWYRISGCDSASIPILILHGGPGTPHDYLEPLGALADERPVVFYDQLGCGRSDRPDDESLWTVERFVEELHQLRNQLEIAQFHILGQSWGSMLAIQYYFTHPSGIRSMVFSGPALSAQRFSKDARRLLAQLPDELQEAVKITEASSDYALADYQKAIEMFYKSFVCRLEPWPDSLNRTIDGMSSSVYEHMWGPSEFTCTGTLKSFDCTNRLNEIKVPVLYTCGRYDEATPETTGFYHSRTPASEITVIEDASHEHHLEKPEEYLTVVRDFLRRAEQH